PRRTGGGAGDVRAAGQPPRRLAQRAKTVAGMNDATLILNSAGLVVLAGFFAASDAAISTVSRARAQEMARERLRGARALQTIANDPPPSTNLLLLLPL